MLLCLPVGNIFPYIVFHVGLSAFGVLLSVQQSFNRNFILLQVIYNFFLAILKDLSEPLFEDDDIYYYAALSAPSGFYSKMKIEKKKI